MHTTNFKKAFQVLLVTGILASVLVSNPANALVIYDQPGTTLPGLRSTTSGGGRGIFDDFELTSDFTLTRIEWTGGLVSFSSSPGTIDPPGVNFMGGIIEDLLGEPDGTSLAPTVSNPTEVFLSSSSLGGITTVVNRYSVDLDSPATLNAGQKYWLAINAFFDALPDDPTLGWDWSFGAGGNDHALVFTGAVPRTPVDNDFSFTLIGSPIPTSVPEPDMLLLLGIGLVAFHLSRRLNSLSRILKFPLLPSATNR